MALIKVAETEELIKQYGFNDWYFQSSTFFTKAECYIMKKEFTKAKDALEEITITENYALSLIKKMEYDHVMGMYLYHTQMYEQSLDYYRRAISIAEKKNIFYEFQNMYNGIAKVLFKLEYIEESDIYKEKADDMTKETIAQANQSMIQKANLSIDIEEKLKEAKRKQKYEGIEKNLNTDKFDELINLAEIQKDEKLPNLDIYTIIN